VETAVAAELRSREFDRLQDRIDMLKIRESIDDPLYDADARELTRQLDKLEKTNPFSFIKPDTFFDWMKMSYKDVSYPDLSKYSSFKN
jgi:hypothetical protein